MLPHRGHPSASSAGNVQIALSLLWHSQFYWWLLLKAADKLQRLLTDTMHGAHSSTLQIPWSLAVTKVEHQSDGRQALNTWGCDPAAVAVVFIPFAAARVHFYEAGASLGAVLCI
jgi:hypothetical protein